MALARRSPAADVRLDFRARMTTRREPLRLLLIAALAVSALVVAGCGNRHDVQTLGETEGVYVDVGELSYQVQMSRILNPADVEDRAYLKGLAAATTPPAKDETWFGVFMRVSNPTDRPLPPAGGFRILDTQEHVFRPVAYEQGINPFVYQPGPLRAGAVYPDPDSAAGEGVIQGSLLLFKVKLQSLQNRPLELKIDPPLGGAAQSAGGTIDLDI